MPEKIGASHPESGHTGHVHRLTAGLRRIGERKQATEVPSTKPGTELLPKSSTVFDAKAAISGMPELALGGNEDLARVRAEIDQIAGENEPPLEAAHPTEKAEAKPPRGSWILQGKYSPFRGEEMTGEDWERTKKFPWRAIRGVGMDLAASMSMGIIFNHFTSSPEVVAAGVLAGEYVGYFGTNYLIKLSERTRGINITSLDRMAVVKDMLGEFGPAEIMDNFVRLPSYFIGVPFVNSHIPSVNVDDAAFQHTLSILRDVGIVLVAKLPSDALFHIYPALYNVGKDWFRQHRRRSGLATASTIDPNVDKAGEVASPEHKGEQG